MKLMCEDHERLSVLRLSGELAAEASEKLRQAVRERVEDGPVHDVVLDVRELSSVDSGGLEALLWVQERCAEKLGQLRLAGCNEDVRTVLRMTRLEASFPMHDDVDGAMRSLG